MRKTVSISKDFTQFPGARFRKDGPFSGEEFRESLLEPLLENPEVTEIVVDLDGVDGYATSFLEEAFGGLVRKFGLDLVMGRVRVQSSDEPSLVEVVLGYMREALE